MMSKSLVLFYALMFYIVGIILGNFFDYWPIIFFIICLVFIFLSLTTKQYLKILFIFLSCLFFGCWCFQFSLPDFSDTNKIYHYNSSTIEFIGEISLVSTSLNRQTLVVNSRQVVALNNTLLPINGRVSLNTSLYPEYQSGDVLKISCRLKDYRQTENQGYANYLFKENIFSTCDFAEIRLIGSKWSPSRLLGKIRIYAKTRINLVLKEPAAAIVNGMLLNDTKNIPTDISQLFSRLGLTHIIAISGSHLVIIIWILLEVFIFFGLNRVKAFWPAVGFIIFYVLLVGAPASAVRSAIMAILVMYSQRIGRLSTSRNTIVSAVALMALFNPRVILFDVGFQLSFLAVLGLSYFSPRLVTWFKFLPEKFGLREIVVATLSAQLLTYPLIIFYFGNFSPYSLLANLLILPVVPFLMGWSILNLVIAMISISLGRVLGMLTFAIVSYWIYLAKLLSSLPGSYWLINFDWYWLILIYIVIYGLYILLTKKDKRNKLN